MAQVGPFRGYRYHAHGTDRIDITSLIAPPYDVQTPDEARARVEADPDNVVAVELAQGSLDPDEPDNRYSNAGKVWRRWMDEGVVARDDRPTVYVLEQCFSAKGREYRRTTFLCEARLHAFEEGVILPHERTLPKALEDRYRLMESTNADLSPIFGLYSDPTDGYATFLEDMKAGSPVATGMMDDVTCTLWAVTDPSLIAQLVSTLSDQQVFIADGHHRYTVALRWRDTVRERIFGLPADEAPRQPGFDWGAPTESVMIALANMDDPQLLVEPYHRALKMEGRFNSGAFLDALMHLFDVRRGTPADLAKADRPAFLFDMGAGDFLAELAYGVSLEKAIHSKHSLPWKQLDVSVLQELVLGPILGVDMEERASLQRMAFSHDVSTLKQRLADGTSDIVFTMRPVTMEQLRSISLSGETMPQKSTYFYPKLPSGFVFRDMSGEA